MAERRAGEIIAAGAIADQRRRQRTRPLRTFPDVGQPYQIDGAAIMPGLWRDRADSLGLPPDCPVAPLGHCEGSYYFTDAAGQLFIVPPGRQMGQDVIQRLFAPHSKYLYWAWPAWTAAKTDRSGAVIEAPKVKGWKAEQVRECLFDACARKGVWNEVDTVRGLGMWRDPASGAPIYHSGDALWTNDGKEMPTGQVGDYFYPRMKPGPAPFLEKVPLSANPCLEILECLKSWSWRRPNIDPLLYLGVIGVSHICGWLDYRPVTYLTGDAGAGKSTLQKFTQACVGRLMVGTKNATSAGIYQKVRHSALSVSVDELEGDGKHAKAIFELAREATDENGFTLRGGQDNKGVQFQSRSSFILSGINRPALPPQDISRLVLLDLGDLDPMRVKARPVLRAADTIAPRMIRLFMERWRQFEPLRQEFSAILREGGHDSRGQDTLGVTLAVAYLLLGDDGAEQAGVLLRDEWSRYGELLGLQNQPSYMRREKSWEDCLRRLLQTAVPAWRHGSRSAIGRLLAEYQAAMIDDAEVNKHLSDVGMRVQALKFADTSGIVRRRRVLCVSNSSPLLEPLFEGTPYAGGVWSTALERAPKRICPTLDYNQQRAVINGQRDYCTKLVLAEIVVPDDGDEKVGPDDGGGLEGWEAA